MRDNLWQRFGTPDYALAFHVSAGLRAGLINVQEGAPFAGADTVDIIVHGVGAHGASPHAGKDPVLLGSQIVVALQSLVSRELPPREAGVVTVGAFPQRHQAQYYFRSRRTAADRAQHQSANQGYIAGGH